MPEGAHPLPGWGSLPFVPLDGKNWPLDVAAKVLGMPLKDLQDLVRIVGLEPSGVIRMSEFRRQGRQPKAYDGEKLTTICDIIGELKEKLSCS